MDISSPLSLVFSSTARCRTWHYNLLLSESRISYNIIMGTWCKRHLRDEKPRTTNVRGHLCNNITHFRSRRSPRPINLLIFPNSIQQLLCVFTLLIFDWNIQIIDFQKAFIRLSNDMCMRNYVLWTARKDKVYLCTYNYLILKKNYTDVTCGLILISKQSN